MAAGLKGAVPENENIGLLWAKHRNFRGKSTALSIKEVRCFQFPEKRPFWEREGVEWGAQQATEGQRQEGRGTAYFLPFGRSQHEFPPVALFAQIYGF